MTESEELAIYKALFCTKKNVKRVETAVKLLNCGMKITAKNFNLNNYRQIYRIKRLLKIGLGLKNG